MFLQGSHYNTHFKVYLKKKGEDLMRYFSHRSYCRCLLLERFLTWSPIKRNRSLRNTLFGKRVKSLIFCRSKVKRHERCHSKRLMLHLFFQNTGERHFTCALKKKSWNWAPRETKETFIFSSNWHSFSFKVILLKMLKNGSENNIMC